MESVLWRFAAAVHGCALGRRSRLEHCSTPRGSPTAYNYGMSWWIGGARARVDHDIQVSGLRAACVGKGPHVAGAQALSFEQRLARRAVRLARLGQAAKAMRTLSGAMRVAIMSPSVEEKLRELHPVRHEQLDNLCLPIEGASLAFDANDEGLRACLRRRLHSGAEAGPSGMREEHLRVFLDDDVLYGAFLRLLSARPTGPEGDKPVALFHSCPTPAYQRERRRTPQKIRPIAMGKLLTRLAGEL